jgi:hypothetical protein
VHQGEVGAAAGRLAQRHGQQGVVDRSVLALGADEAPAPGDELGGHQPADLGLEAAGRDARVGVPDPIAAAGAFVHFHPRDLVARCHPAADQFG